MVSEDVRIRPILGISATTHAVEFRCTFVLRNLSATPATIQVGFPLDRDWLGRPPPPSHDTEEVLSYHFIARDAENTYHVRFVPADLQRRFARIFLWEMRFVANETKTLHVGYVLPMSTAAGTTRMASAAQNAFSRLRYEKPWHVRTEACLKVFFSYVTETGQSWAGTTETARFQFSNTAFERCLREYPEYLGRKPVELLRDSKVPDEASPTHANVGPMAEAGFVAGMKLGAVYRQITPAGWKPSYDSNVPAGKPKPSYEPDSIAWDFDNYEPGVPLRFSYYLLGFPETVADCQPWVRRILGEAGRKEDVLELREIVGAFFGIEPKTASVKRLVECQVWYQPESHLGGPRLSEARRAVLKRLQVIADEIEQKTKQTHSQTEPSSTDRQQTADHPDRKRQTDHPAENQQTAQTQTASQPAPPRAKKRSHPPNTGKIYASRQALA